MGEFINFQYLRKRCLYRDCSYTLILCVELSTTFRKRSMSNSVSKIAPETGYGKTDNTRLDKS